MTISRKYEIAEREQNELPLNVGISGQNGWWREFVAADVGGRITVNDSCNGTINGDGISLDSCGMSLFIESVIFPSGFLGGSGAGKSQRARSPFTIATEALIRPATCLDSLAQELFSNQHTCNIKTRMSNLTLSLSRMLLPRLSLVSLRDFTTDANNQRVC